MQYWLIGEQGGSAGWPIAADEYERQTSRRDNLRDGTDIEASNIDVENRQIKQGSASQRFGCLNTTGLGNYLMSKLLKHIDDHHLHDFVIFKDGTSQIILHYEHPLCGLSHSYCKATSCLHQVYVRSVDRRYRLVRSFYVAQPEGERF